MKVIKFSLFSIIFLAVFIVYIFNNDQYYIAKGKLYNAYIYTKYHLYDLYWLVTTADYKNKTIQDNHTDTDKIIAHAGGQIDHYIYTNTLEALNKSYKKGFRLFELDIITTKDNYFVASHDWKRWRKQTNYKKTLPPTLEEFKKLKILNKYTSLDMQRINKWFAKHTDAILITDKVNRPLAFSKQFIDKNRLIMELFDWYAVKQALSLHIKAMPTGKIVRKLKMNIAKKLVDLKIKQIALSRKYIDHYKPLLKQLKDHGIKTYAFNLDFKKGKDETYFYCNELNYFYGFYANQWDFTLKSLNCKEKRYKNE